MPYYFYFLVCSLLCFTSLISPSSTFSIPSAGLPMLQRTQYRKFETNITRKGTGRLQPNFHNHVSVCDYMFPWSVCLFCCRKICWPNYGNILILTDKWMYLTDHHDRNHAKSGSVNSSLLELVSCLPYCKNDSPSEGVCRLTSISWFALFYASRLWFPLILLFIPPPLSTHYKDTIPKIRKKHFQKRNCAATVLISTFMFL